jgi:hypothetical protein
MVRGGFWEFVQRQNVILDGFVKIREISGFLDETTDFLFICGQKGVDKENKI